MALKSVSIWIGNRLDPVTNLSINGNNYSAASCEQLVSEHSSVFWFELNSNGQWDLCFKIDDSVPYVVGSFTAYGTTNAYQAQSWDFEYIGGQPKPKPRCPGCI
jgi:hypothetical protein